MDLSHNALGSLSNGVSALRNLKTLDISFNPIKELPLTLTSLKGTVRELLPFFFVIVSFTFLVPLKVFVTVLRDFFAI